MAPEELSASAIMFAASIFVLKTAFEMVNRKSKGGCGLSEQDKTYIHENHDLALENNHILKQQSTFVTDISTSIKELSRTISESRLDDVKNNTRQTLILERITELLSK